MTFSSRCQCYFFLLLLVLATSALQTHARESKFFSKVTRPEPEPTATNPKAESEIISPSSSPSKEATTELGYGLLGQEEKDTPTATNPTKLAPQKFTYVQSNGVSKEFEMLNKNSNGYHYGAGEKQGMSDTRVLENGRYFYDVNNENKVENNGNLIENDDGHESYNGYKNENGNHYPEEMYGAGEKQGMSDTRFLENGRYFYDIQGETKNNGDGYSNNVEFYNNNNSNENEEEEEEEGKYEKEGYGTGEKQGMTNSRFIENERYFYDTHYPEKKSNGDGYSNNVEFYNNNNYENKEKEKGEEKYKEEGHGTGEKQGMSDTRFLDNGRYFYDINAEKNNNYNGYGNSVEFYNNNNNQNYEKDSYEPEKFRYHRSKGQSYNKYEKESGKHKENGNRYDFRSTQNKFPNFEFDSMEEYEKYEQNRRHQNVYKP